MARAVQEDTRKVLMEANAGNGRVAMKMARLFLSVLGLGLVLGTLSAAAQSGVCLRTQQIDNWEVVDDRTLIVTDRLDRQYRLGLVGSCTGLQQTRFSLGFETFSELSCVRPGDSIRYNDLTFGPERCRITSVESYIAEEPENPNSENPKPENPGAEG